MTAKKACVVGCVAVLAIFMSALSAGLAFAGCLDEGKTELLTNKDIVKAHAKFDLALQANPNGQIENFWHAIAVISANSDLRAKLRGLNIFNSSDEPIIFDAEQEMNYNAEANADNIIVDDGSIDYHDTGGWQTLGSPDPKHPYDSDCRYHNPGTGTNTAVWNPNITTTGYYEVYAWIPKESANTSNAEYTIVHSNGTSKKNISQYGYGDAGWVSLGEYCFIAGNTGTIVLSDKTTSGRVIADAVKFVYHGVTKDNTDAIFQPTDAEWQTVTGRGFNNNHRWHAAGASASVKWMLDITDISKKYLIFASWPNIGNGAASTARYSVYQNNALSATIEMDHEGNANKWCCLGIYQFSGTPGNYVMLSSSADGKVAADAIRIVPARPYPNLTEGQAMAQNTTDPSRSALVQIDEALSNLSHIDNVSKNFSDTVTTAQCNKLTEDADLDYAEAKLLETALYFIRMDIKIDAAYEMNNTDVQPAVFGRSDSTLTFFMDKYSNLFTLRSGVDNAALLAEAKAAVQNGIVSYLSASDYMRNSRSDNDGLNHLISFYPPYDPLRYASYEEWEGLRNSSLYREEVIRGLIADVQTNLEDPQHPVVDISPFLFDEERNKPFGLGTDVRIDINSFFSVPKPLRTYINEIAEHDIIYDSVSQAAATLGGIFPDFIPMDWNYILHCAPNTLNPASVVWNGENASVSLTWSISHYPPISNITKYEIRRSLKADVNLLSELVATITDPQAANFIDNSIDSSQDSYYYRLYTYYNVGSGQTAATYSEMQEARLRVYVDVNSAPTYQDGTKDYPIKDLGDAVRHWTRNGTRVCIAYGTYDESSYTMWLGNKNGLILEGGYEPVNWTRNIQNNETIVDAKGSYSTLGIWGVDNATIDGLTIKGAAGRGVEVYRNFITLRNCKIIGNNQCGVYASGASSLLIKDCNISGNSATTSTDGIYISGSRSCVIDGCVIDQNGRDGIYCNPSSNSNISIFNSIISSNNRRGIYCDSGSSNVSINVSSTTIAGNKENGVYASINPGSLALKNNIITNNTGYGVYRSSGTVTIIYNDVFGNTSGNYYNCGPIPASNISSDPIFVTGPKGGYYLSQTAAGQAANSPCVDAGSDTAQNLGLSGMTTRTDNVADADMADIGYHYYYMPAPTKDEVIIDFGNPYGIWVRYNDAFWTQLHTVSPKSMITGDLDGNGKDDVIIDFGAPYGIWIRYNDLTWTQLHTVSPKSMVTGDLDGNGKDEVIIDFGEPHGIWIRYNNTSWTQLPVVSPESMTTGDIDGNGKDDLIIDFGPEFGIWIYRDNGTWTQLHNISPKSMVTGDIDASGKDDIIIDFGSPYGIWIRYNDSTWQQLHTISPKSMAVGDIDGNGKKDIIIDFGSEYGIWIRYNDSSWTQLHSVSAKSITTGDIDGNGKDDIIVDFGSQYGIWIRYNNSSWTQLHSVSAKSVATGELDNDSRT